MQIKTRTKILDLNTHTHIMGILNVTPDSFSDGGKYNELEKAVDHAKQMVADGADIIDVGGESMRPGHKPVSVEEEITRVVPVIEALRAAGIAVPISIDTYKAETAAAALQAGADIINDVWGAKYDPEIAAVARAYDAPIILMHNRNNKSYTSIIDEMIRDLEESIAIAKQAGVDDQQIILDPGIGFGKELADNYTVMQQLDKLIAAFPYPFLLGTSRKSFISKVLDVPAIERDNATGATTCLGIVKGVKIVRVHDVKRNVELAKMMDAMLKGLDGDG